MKKDIAMTNDEKAKAYDDALERARKIHNEIINNEIIGFPDQIREIFPQLRESEDERIRKWLVDYFSSIKATVWIHRDITCEQILEWLEKQKEQKVDIDKLRKDIYQSGYNDGYQHGKEDAQKEQPSPAEWSEEDEKMLTDISWAIRHCAYDDKKKERVMKWFNDDYRKFLRPSCRPSWKPSDQDELMKLKYAGTSTKLD